jgi:hypothetical protein
MTTSAAPVPDLESLEQIAQRPVWDGNLISKSGRDTLVRAGFVARRAGWNILTTDGLALAVELGFLKA